LYEVMGNRSESSTRPSKRSGVVQRPKWQEDWHLLGNDSGYPSSLRRYFDEIPSEVSMPKQPVRLDVARLFPREKDIFSSAHPTFAPDIADATARRQRRTSDSLEVYLEEREKNWENKAHLTCSVDNGTLHPMLRHYFDRRGLEASYRTRPHIDKVAPRLPPRTPGRPSTREKILRHYVSDSAINLSTVEGKRAAALAAADPDVEKRAVEDNIHWGRRCLMVGPDASVKQAPDGSKIPWVGDHHLLESDDSVILNPRLRHYFGDEGLESSFRMRGRHYGRPLPAVMGLPPLPTIQPAPKALPKEPPKSREPKSKPKSKLSKALMAKARPWASEELIV